MFTIHHYEQPDRYKFVTLRAQKVCRQRRIETVKRWAITALVIAFFVLALGIVGENDRQSYMLDHGISSQGK